jgi:hypothetical protein
MDDDNGLFCQLVRNVSRVHCAVSIFLEEQQHVSRFGGIDRNTWDKNQLISIGRIF